MEDILLFEVDFGVMVVKKERVNRTRPYDFQVNRHPVSVGQAHHAIRRPKS